MLFIAFRELMSARGNALPKLSKPVENDCVERRAQVREVDVNQELLYSSIMRRTRISSASRRFVLRPSGQRRPSATGQFSTNVGGAACFSVIVFMRNRWPSRVTA